jgi:hypothetical protein
VVVSGLGLGVDILRPNAVFSGPIFNDTVSIVADICFSTVFMRLREIMAVVASQANWQALLPSDGRKYKCSLLE